MDIKPIIKRRLRPAGLDKHDILVDAIESAIRTELEEKAARLITPRLIKKAFSELVDKTKHAEGETETTTLS
jgi:hypothetical protein